MLVESRKKRRFVVKINERAHRTGGPLEAKGRHCGVLALSERRCQQFGGQFAERLPLLSLEALEVSQHGIVKINRRTGHDA
jgi:hypothetical protein